MDVELIDQAGGVEQDSVVRLYREHALGLIRLALVGPDQAGRHQTIRRLGDPALHDFSTIAAW